jgi:hypothetical protein
MKKILTVMFVIALLAIAGTAQAIVQLEEIEIDTPQECTGDGIKLQNWNEALDSGNSITGEYSDGTITIEITAGDYQSFTWESDMPVCTIYVKAGKGGTLEYDTEGSYGGTIDISEETKYDISHVSFCYGGCGTTTEVPEFPTLAIPIAAIIGLAFIIQRRKE